MAKYFWLLLLLLPLAQAFGAYTNVDVYNSWNNTQPVALGCGVMYYENSNTSGGWWPANWSRMVAGSGNGIWKPASGNDMLRNSTQSEIINFTAYVPNPEFWAGFGYGSNQTTLDAVTIHGYWGMIAGSRGHSLTAYLYPDVKLIGTVYRDTEGSTEFTWTIPAGINTTNIIRFAMNATYTGAGSDNFYLYNLTLSNVCYQVGNYPQYFQVSNNGTYAGKATLFSANWTDFGNSPGIQNYTFSFDNGNGTMINDSAVGFGGGWANATKGINLILGSAIRWRWYVWSKNSTLVLMNSTPIYTDTSKAVDWFISAFDENNQNAPKWFNLTISNASNTTNFVVNYTWFNKTIYETPTGVVTLTAKNASCQTNNILPRTFTWDTSQGAVNWSIQFLCDGTNYVSQAIQVLQQGIQTPVAGANINITRVINGVNQTIDYKQTDSAGVVTDFLTTGIQYYYTVSKDGYNTTVVLITGTGQPTTIYLTANSLYNQFDDILKYFSWSVQPEGTLSYPVFTVNASVNGTGLQYYGLYVELANGTRLYFVNNTGATGGLINSDVFNRTGWNGTLYATLFVGKIGYNPFYYTRTFSIMNVTDSNSSLTGITNYLAQTDMPPAMKFFAATMGSLVFASALFAGGLGSMGAGLGFVAAFAFFALAVGFVESNVFYFIAIVTLAVYFINRGW